MNPLRLAAAASLFALAPLPVSAESSVTAPTPLRPHRAVDGCSMINPALPPLVLPGSLSQGRSRVIGFSRSGREITAEHWGPSVGPQVLVLAQVHGDECAANVLVDVIRNSSLSFGVWLVPTLNPDGSASFSRRNAAGVDLNRDGIAATQPETRALLRFTRALRPALTVHVHSPYGWVGFYGSSVSRTVARDPRLVEALGSPRFAGDGYGFLWEGQSRALPDHPSLLVEFPAMFEKEASTAPRAEDRRTGSVSEVRSQVIALLSALEGTIGSAPPRMDRSAPDRLERVLARP